MIPKGSRARIVDAFLRRSFLWPFAEEFKLTINERVQRRGDSAEHREVGNYVLQLGNGEH